MTQESNSEKNLVSAEEESDACALVESLKQQVETLQKSEMKLGRQLKRLQDTVARDKALALTRSNVGAVLLA